MNLLGDLFRTSYVKLYKFFSFDLFIIIVLSLFNCSNDIDNKKTVKNQVLSSTKITDTKSSNTEKNTKNYSIASENIEAALAECKPNGDVGVVQKENYQILCIDVKDTADSTMLKNQAEQLESLSASPNLEEIKKRIRNARYVKPYATYKYAFELIDQSFLRKGETKEIRDTLVTTSKSMTYTNINWFWNKVTGQFSCYMTEYCYDYPGFVCFWDSFNTVDKFLRILINAERRENLGEAIAQRDYAKALALLVRTSRIYNNDQLREILNLISQSTGIKTDISNLKNRADLLKETVTNLVDALLAKDYPNLTAAERAALRQKKIDASLFEIAVRERNPVLCGACGGNPVRVSSGIKETYAVDLEIPFGAENIRISRKHSFNNKNNYSLGKGWFFNYDTRVVVGVKKDADLLYTTAKFILQKTEDRLTDTLTVKNELNTTLTEITTLVNQASSKLDTYRANINSIENRRRAAQTETNNALSNRNGAISAGNLAIQYANAYNGPETPGIIADANAFKSMADSEYNQAVSLYNQIVSAINNAHFDLALVESQVAAMKAIQSNLENKKTQIIATEESLKKHISELTIEIAELKNDSDIAGALRVRNADAVDPDNMDDQSFGNGYIKWIDEYGTDRFFQLNADGTTTPYDSAQNGIQNKVTFVQNANLTYTIRTAEGTVYEFGKDGLISSKTDRNGNKLTFIYETDSDFYANGNSKKLVTGIVDSFGRALVFKYKDNHLVSVIDPLERVFGYEYEEGKLKGFIDQMQKKVSYEYEGLNLIGIIDRNGGERSYEYEVIKDVPRVVKETDELGNNWEFTYDFDNKITRNKDRRGYVTTYYGNDRGSTKRIVHPDSTEEQYEYDENQNLVFYRNERGYVTTYDYGDSNTMTAVHFTDGTSQYFKYDEFGKVVEFTDQAGNRTQFIRDVKGNVIEERRPDNSVIKHVYNDLGLLIYTLDPRGYKTQYFYDLYGNLNMIKTPLWGVYRIENDIVGRPIVQVAPDGGVTSIEYNALNRITQIKDALDRVTQFEYLPEGELLSRLEPGNRKFTYEYDKAGQLITIIEPRCYRVDFAYDKSGNRTEMTIQNTEHYAYTFDKRNRLITTEQKDLDMKWEYRYSFTGTLTKTIDPLGNSTLFYLDRMDRTYKKIDPLGGETCYMYNQNGDLLKIKDALGNITSLVRDPMGRVVQKIDALNQTTRYDYDLAGNITKVTDPKGAVTYIGHNALNQIETIKNALGYRTQFKYDKKGHLIERIDPNSASTKYEYDLLDRVTTIQDALGGVIAYAYDSKGNMKSFTNQNGETYTYFYNARNRLATITDPLGNRTEYQWDKFDRRTDIINPLGERAHYYYDVMGRLASIVQPDKSRTAFEYDNASRVISKTDPLKRKTAYSYDSLGRLIKVAGPMGGETYYNYNLAGSLIEVIDPKGNKTGFEYDAVYRLISQINASGQATQYSYDPAGNLIKRIWADGTSTSYAYNKLNRLIKRFYSNGRIDSFTYDSMENVIKIANADSEETYQYDLLNRKVSVNNASLGLVIGYAYDNAGRRIAMTSPLNPNRTTSYEYDKAGRLTALEDPFDSTHSAEYEYNSAGRITAKRYGNGVQTQYAYDLNGRVISIESSVLSFQYEYDLAGNVITRRRNSALESMTYDNNDRLISYMNNNITTAYSYDSAGNRVRETNSLHDVLYSYNELNQLMSRDSSTGHTDYAYDLRGNRMSEVTNGSTVMYAYTIENQLEGVRLPGGYTFNYKFDALDRRVFKGLSYETSAGTQIEENHILYDKRQGLLELDEMMQPLALHTFRPSHKVYGELINSRIFKKSFNDEASEYQDFLAEFDQNPVTEADFAEEIPTSFGNIKNFKQYYHTDTLGTTWKTTDSYGYVRKNYNFDAWGSLIAHSTGQPFTDVHQRWKPAHSLSQNGLSANLFTGKEYDFGVDTHHLDARAYEARGGRFLQSDPYNVGSVQLPKEALGIVAVFMNIKNIDNQNLKLLIFVNPEQNASGVQSISKMLKLNQYVYGLNSPLVFVDPFGLDDLIVDMPGGYGDFDLAEQEYLDELFENSELIDSDYFNNVGKIKGSSRNTYITSINNEYELNYLLNNLDYLSTDINNIIFAGCHGSSTAAWMGDVAKDSNYNTYRNGGIYAKNIHANINPNINIYLWTCHQAKNEGEYDFKNQWATAFYGSNKYASNIYGFDYRSDTYLTKFVLKDYILWEASPSVFHRIQVPINSVINSINKAKDSVIDYFRR